MGLGNRLLSCENIGDGSLFPLEIRLTKSCNELCKGRLFLVSSATFGWRYSRNFGLDQKVKFQVDVISGKRFNLSKARAVVVEIMDNPAIKDAGDEDTSVEEDGMPLKEMDEEIEVKANNDVLAEQDTEQQKE